MILQSFQHRFNAMKSNHDYINYVLDIGAYRGDFTETVKSVFPNAIVRQFEADDRQLPYLQNNAIIALLGDETKDDINFYTLDDDKITTGSSIYKEMTSHYMDSTTVILKKSMTTIDSLNEQYNFFGDWENFGLVKIDTQGSELLILDGAKKFLSSMKPKYILLECSILQYNSGAPLFHEVCDKMHQLGYSTNDVFDLSYNEHHQLLQMDVLFKRG